MLTTVSRRPYVANSLFRCYTGEMPRENPPPQKDLQEGKDFYFNEQGLMVFTSAYHLKRGHCCESGCKHCPYGYRKKEGEEK